MGKTNGLLAATGAIAILATMSVPGAAAVGEAGLRPAAPAGHVILVAKKKKPPNGQQIDKQLSQSGYKQQIQQYMGQDGYQQMMGGQGLPGR
jgi:hypothetical protein